MSKIHLASTLAVGVCVLVLAGTLPLAAQTAPDGAGVSVELGSAAVMHRTGIFYPASALAKRVEGTVVAQVTLDASGNVSDARVVSGPDEFRKAVLQAVLQWHFVRDVAGATRQVSVAFQAPQPSGQPAFSGTFSSAPGVLGGLGGGPIGGMVNRPSVMTVNSIDVYGLPDQARAELLASLPVHAGETFTAEAMPKISAAVRQFDEHLSVQIMGPVGGEVDVAIVAPGASPPFRASFATGTATVSGSTGAANQARLVRQVQPLYPPLAKQARIQGTVIMNATIAKDGTVQNIAVVSGHALLVQAALDAVRQWVYQPTLVNGQPVEVSTQISLNFTLASEPAVQQ